MIGALPTSAFGLARAPQAAQAAPAPEPFVWGKGGRRLTPEEAEMQRKLGMAQMQGGADFSPVGHWTQGLARATQGVLGGLQVADARKASDANAAESAAVIEVLLAEADNPQAGNGSVLAALANPNLSPKAQQIAEMEYQRRNPKAAAPTEFERLLRGQGIMEGSPEWVEANRRKLENELDPFANFQGPNFSYVGRQSALLPTLQGGGDPASGAAPGASEPPAVLPPDFAFGEERSPAPAPGGFPGGFRGLSGEKVTSTFRDPAKNRSVGGVRNSFHTRRDGKGNPMARDSVPPPGMSMSAYAERLRALNPWAQVINEGDHVHMEPK